MKATLVLGVDQGPYQFTHATTLWPPGIYVPAPGESDAFDAILVGFEGDSWSLNSRGNLFRGQNHVSNIYVRAPQGTKVVIA